MGQSLVRIAFTPLMVCANFCSWARIAASVASVAAEASCMIQVSAFSRGAKVAPFDTVAVVVVVVVVVVAGGTVVVATGTVVVAIGTVVVAIGTVVVAIGTVVTTGAVAMTVDDVETPGTVGAAKVVVGMFVVGNGGRVGAAPFEDAHAPSATVRAMVPITAICGRRTRTTVVVAVPLRSVTRSRARAQVM